MLGPAVEVAIFVSNDVGHQLGLHRKDNSHHVRRPLARAELLANHRPRGAAMLVARDVQVVVDPEAEGYINSRLLTLCVHFQRVGRGK
eukprot:5857833-Pyramimonas_sp.AAC.1